jgi:hypothetical protein
MNRPMRNKADGESSTGAGNSSPSFKIARRSAAATFMSYLFHG